MMPIIRLLPVLFALIVMTIPYGEAMAAYDSDTESMGLAKLVQRDSVPAVIEPQSNQTVTIITGEWVDVRDILKFVAKTNGYSLQIAPDVTGLANVHLENVDIHEALRAILEPIGLGYELVGDQLLIYKHGLATRWFEFDYMVTSRKGQGVLRVSGRGQSSASSGGEENNSQITTATEMDIWPEIVNALKVLIFTNGGEDNQSNTESGMVSISLADEEGRSLVVSPMAGLIQATAEWNRLRQAEVYLARMRNALLRQVAIEVQILEVTLNDNLNAGINWNSWYNADNGTNGTAELNTAEGLAGMATPFFRFVVNGKSISGLLEMVQEQGQIKVVSTPRITTLNNQKAIVRVITEEVFYKATVEPPIVTNGVVTEPVIAYSPEIIPVGLVLDVTPQISSKDMITLSVHPTITDIVRIATSPNEDTAPILSVRELDTVGKVLDGQTLVIAGLLSDGLRDTQHMVPGLGRIPILGNLFKRTVKSETKTELVILLTPVILNNSRVDEWSTEALESVQSKM
ncbi:MAG: hypothetical protein GY835_25800 [bacterium]|nr:hypothetical protein [bacterium]